MRAGAARPRRLSRGALRAALAAALASLALPAAAETPPPVGDRRGGLEVAPLYSRAPYGRCAVAATVLCRGSDCAPAEPAPRSYVVLDLPDNRLRRCVDDACSDHSLTLDRRGVYSQLSIDGGPEFFRALNDAGAFVEVVVEDNGARVRTGACAPTDPADEPALR